MRRILEMEPKTHMSPYEVWMKNRGKQLPRRWREKLQAKRKRQRRARKAHRAR